MKIKAECKSINAPLPVIDAENGGVSIRATGCEKYMSVLRYGQVGADGVRREKEAEEHPKSAEEVPKSAEEVPKSAGVKTLEGQQLVIYEYVIENKAITTMKACELLEVKERRARSVLASMCKKGYLKKQGATSSLKYILNK